MDYNRSRSAEELSDSDFEENDREYNINIDCGSKFDAKIIYRTETTRLDTFDHWEKQSFLKKERLAKDGFYCLNDGDKVECVFCGVKLCNWVKGDDVHSEHRKHSPNCPFINGQNVGNVPRMMSASISMNVELHERFPDYSSYESRLESFEDWPKAMSQRPPQLAAAGFYYKGKGLYAVRPFFA